MINTVKMKYLKSSLRLTWEVEGRPRRRTPGPACAGLAASLVQTLGVVRLRSTSAVLEEVPANLVMGARRSGTRSEPSAVPKIGRPGDPGPETDPATPPLPTMSSADASEE